MLVIASILFSTIPGCRFESKEKSGRWQRAFQQLPHCDLSLDVVTFNATLSACEKGREWHWAVQQLQQMESLGSDK